MQTETKKAAAQAPCKRTWGNDWWLLRKEEETDEQASDCGQLNFIDL